MTQAKIAAKQPASVQLKQEQTVYWCACGRSAGQPFCDGSHKGTGFNPVAYTANADETVYFCQCKQTGTSPKCDGTHRKL